MIRRWGIRSWTRHSLILVFAGLMYVAIGIAFLNTPAIYTKDPSLKIALEWFTFDQWGIIYICCGGLTILSSMWPIGSEKWGYTVLTAISSMWSAFYLLAVIFEGVPKLVLIQSLLWGILAFLWWAVSGLISPQGLKQVVVPHGPD